MVVRDFQLTNGSLAAMAYVLTGAGLKVRSYYKDSARGCGDICQIMCAGVMIRLSGMGWGIAWSR